MMADIEKILKGADTKANVSVVKKDFVVKSKDRITTKKLVERALTSKKVQFSSVFKSSKSSSIDVLTITNVGDVIFKPIIQKGAGGVKFEHELEADLINFFNGAEEGFKHKDTITEMAKVLKISAKEPWKVIAEGSKNQKRELKFDGRKVMISNSTGETLTDLTLEKGSKKMYLSLKMSKQYYTLSASIFKYFLDPKTQVQMNEFFGMDGMEMGGFGKEYLCKTKKPNYIKAAENIRDVLSQAIGEQVVIIHKKRDGDSLVKNVGKSNAVSVGTLTADSYRYPAAGVRKYANIKIKAKINKKNYNVNFQFRGTTSADKGPKYLRILLERLD